jgi:hypothetical protein
MRLIPLKPCWPIQPVLKNALDLAVKYNANSYLFLLRLFMANPMKKKPFFGKIITATLILWGRAVVTPKANALASL